jgi:hypothetical protein
MIIYPPILNSYFSEEQKAKLEECMMACSFKAKAALPELMKRITENVKPLLPPSSQFTQGTLLSEGGSSPAPAPSAGLPGFGAPGPGVIPGPGVGGIPLPGGGLPGSVPGNLPKLG